jgi:cell division protein FtsZ
MTLNLSAPGAEQNLKPRIVVVGVGGAGCNAVNNMISTNLEGVEFVVANTDAQALSQSASERRIQLGVNITSGLGAGARPDIGRAAAEEALDTIIDHLQGCHMAFITAGMGGGTGTGAGPVIARAAREQGILTVGVVTKPFQFEGNHRMRLAEEGIEELQHFVDTLIVIPNQNLFRICNENTTFADAFRMADNVLHSGVRGVTDLMVMPGMINLDFADIRTVMSEMGKAMMGTGEAGGEKRSVNAAEAAIANPLLDDVSMRGARGVLINITGGPDMTLFEVDEAANRVREEVDPDANIIFGSTFDANMEGAMRVSIVATGIDAEASTLPRPAMISLVHDADRGRTAAPAQPKATPAAEPPVETTAEVAPAETAAVADETPKPAVAEARPDLIEAAMAAQAAAKPAGLAMPQRSEPAAPVAASAFIAPKPVEPAVSEAGRMPAPRKAEPFAEAAMTNAPAKEEKRRGRSLFQKVTGAMNGLVGDEPAAAPRPVQQRREPTAGPSLPPATPVATPTAEVPAPRPVVQPAPEPAPQPVQPTLANLDQSESSQGTGSDDDMLEIPAFLRRQAN